MPTHHDSMLGQAIDKRASHPGSVVDVYKSLDEQKPDELSVPSDLDFIY